jgi:hypothetical protein
MKSISIKNLPVQLDLFSKNFQPGDKVWWNGKIPEVTINNREWEFPPMPGHSYGFYYSEFESRKVVNITDYNESVTNLTGYKVYNINENYWVLERDLEYI